MRRPALSCMMVSFDARKGIPLNPLRTTISFQFRCGLRRDCPAYTAPTSVTWHRSAGWVCCQAVTKKANPAFTSTARRSVHMTSPGELPGFGMTLRCLCRCAWQTPSGPESSFSSRRIMLFCAVACPRSLSTTSTGTVPKIVTSSCLVVPGRGQCCVWTGAALDTVGRLQPSRSQSFRWRAEETKFWSLHVSPGVIFQAQVPNQYVSSIFT